MNCCRAKWREATFARAAVRIIVDQLRIDLPRRLGPGRCPRRSGLGNLLVAVLIIFGGDEIGVAERRVAPAYERIG